MRPVRIVLTPLYSQTLVRYRPMLAKLKAVDVRGCANLEGKNQFVARTIKGSHPTIVLDPHNEIPKLGIDVPPCSLHLPDVSPIHAKVMDGAVDAVVRHVLESGRQERDELAR